MPCYVGITPPKYSSLCRSLYKKTTSRDCFGVLLAWIALECSLIEEIVIAMVEKEVDCFRYYVRDQLSSQIQTSSHTQRYKKFESTSRFIDESKTS